MMLCKSGKESDILKYHLKYLGNQKFDGCRCLAICDEQVRLIGRNDGNYTSKFSEIVNDLKGLKCVLDGEICCDTFEHTLSRNHTENRLKIKLLEKEYPAIFYVFDILSLNGEDLTQKPLIERIRALQGLSGLHNSIVLVKYTPDLINLWEMAKKENWEGIIIKNPLGRYEGKRSWNWLKIKYIKSRDLLVKNYDINPAGIRVEEKGIACQIAGTNGQIVKKIIDETGSCLIEVNYLNETKSGLLRQPTFKCIK